MRLNVTGRNWSGTMLWYSWYSTYSSYLYTLWEYLLGFCRNEHRWCWRHLHSWRQCDWWNLSRLHTEVFATATHAIQWLQSQLYRHPGRCLCTQMWGDSQDYQWCWPPARFSTTLQPPIEELFAEVKRYLKAYDAVVKATTTPEAIVHTAFVVYYYYYYYNWENTPTQV